MCGCCSLMRVWFSVWFKADLHDIQPFLSSVGVALAGPAGRVYTHCTLEMDGFFCLRCMCISDGV